MGNLRRFKSDAGWGLICFLVAVIRRLNLPAVIRLGRCLGWVLSHLLSLRKSVALLNLDVAFGQSMSRRRKRRVFRKAAAYVTTMGLETLRYCFEPPEAIRTNITISGVENLSAAASGGQGVVLAGGHVGTFTLFAVRLTG